jgi:hypothetical protein
MRNYLLVQDRNTFGNLVMKRQALRKVRWRDGEVEARKERMSPLISIFAYQFQKEGKEYYFNLCHRTSKNAINNRFSYKSENV